MRFCRWITTAFATLAISSLTSCGLIDKTWVEFFCLWDHDKTCQCAREEVRGKKSARCNIEDKGGVPQDRFRLSSACICGLPDGRVQGWFLNRPQIYNTFPNHQIQLLASDCVDISACPVWNDGYQYVLTGKFLVFVEEWKHTQWINGNEVWSLIARQAAPKRPAAGIPNFLLQPSGDDARMMRVSISSETIDCRKACDPNDADDLLCREAAPDTTVQGQLSEFRSTIASTVEGTISLADVKKMFNVKDTACDRGDIEVSGDSIVNNGEACRIDSTIWVGEDPVPLVMHVPPEVQGRVTRADGQLTINFDNRERAFVLELQDEALNSELGGAIEVIEATPTKALITTEFACIGVALGKDP